MMVNVARKGVESLKPNQAILDLVTESNRKMGSVRQRYAQHEAPIDGTQTQMGLHKANVLIGKTEKTG
jgi:hypothetical protein